MQYHADLSGPVVIKVSKGAKIRNRFDQVPHLTKNLPDLQLLTLYRIETPFNAFANRAA